ncbi:MAG: hypothetical protein WBC18_02350 [Ottowia sp.]|uniref:hypothetical protein n=1 Tax=unclassified Ottowia TaxID=2645081 RepID=UPI003C2C8E80
MLTPQDDLIGHQTPTTFDHVESSDPAWMERLWYTGHPIPGGDIIFDLGIGYHPNRNVMDGFAGVTIGTKQYNLRLSRRLRPDPLRTRIGPLEISVIEGLRKHRLTLAENDSGIRFDLEYLATMNPHEEAPHFRRRHGRVTENLMRVQQFGKYSGWIEVHGKRYEVSPDTWLGQRDHSWGIRAEMCTDETRPPMTPYPPLFWTWTTVQFPEYGVQWYFNERAPGNLIYLTGEQTLPLGKKIDRGLAVDSISHEIDWMDDPLGQTLRSGVFEIEFANGTRRTLQMRALPGRYFLKGGLYGGYRGWAQGDDKGPLYSEHDQWDLTDPETRRLARTLSDHVIEVTDGDQVGYGIIEYGVVSGYPKYQSLQMHPGM